jgi:hypothetical protein
MSIRVILTMAVCAAFLLPAEVTLAKEGRVIVVDGSGQVKRPGARPGSDTRVINLKGPKSRRPKAGPGGDVCPSLSGRFYCAHVGKTAVESGTGEALGEIVGVAWKDTGEAITRYLPEGWLTKEGEEVLELNAPAREEGFFYIIRSKGRLTFMVECSRISPGNR